MRITLENNLRKNNNKFCFERTDTKIGPRGSTLRTFQSSPNPCFSFSHFRSKSPTFNSVHTRRSQNICLASAIYQRSNIMNQYVILNKNSPLSSPISHASLYKQMSWCVNEYIAVCHSCLQTMTFFIVISTKFFPTKQIIHFWHVSLFFTFF